MVKKIDTSDADIWYLDEWLKQINLRVIELQKIGSDRKIKVYFSIGSIVQSGCQKPYLTPIRFLENGVISGVIVFSQTESIIAAGALIDKVDKILVDSEKKLGIQVEFNKKVRKKFSIKGPDNINKTRGEIEFGNISSAVRRIVPSEMLIEYKPNDLTVDSIYVLEAAKDLKVKKIIHTSTSEVYGSAKKVPITELHQINPQSPYAASKAAADNIVNSYYKSFNMPIITLRPFNNFGPRQSLRAIIPTIITQVIKNKSMIKLGNVNSTRDFTFVDDTTDAFLLALNNKKCIGQTLNIGNNFEISIKDIFKETLKISNKKIKLIIDKKRLRPKNSEVDRLYSSNLKAKKILNWKPKYNGIKGFKSALKETYRWYLNKENIKFFKTNIYNQ